MLNDEDLNQVDQLISQEMSFSTAKYGDTPTDAQQLTPKKYVDAQIASVISGIPASSVPAVFGDGSDGAITLGGSTFYSFASIVGNSTYSQLRDVYATTYTINDGVSVKPNLYRTFVSSVFHAQKSSIISKGSNAVANIGGASIAAGYFPSVAAAPNGSGGGGPQTLTGAGNAGSDGVRGSSVTHSYGVAGSDTRTAATLRGGGANLFNGGQGGLSASGGGVTPYTMRPIPIFGVQTMVDIDGTGTILRMTGSATSASGPGGGGGANAAGVGSSGQGGTGGGAGGNGGTIAIYAKALQLDAGSIIDVRGGTGGDGGNGQNASVQSANQLGGGAGGNGGSGGQGGYVILMYNTLQSIGSIITAGGFFGSGGTGGTGASSGGAGEDGVAGFSGSNGSVMSFKIT